MAPRQGNPDQTEKETKRDRFKRLAEARTKAVLAKIKVLGRCANHATYEYTAEDVKKIFGTIRDRLEDVETRFAEKPADEEDFTL